MQEALLQILSYAIGAWRYRWTALSVAWILALGGWFLVWQMPEAYVATARVNVDTNSVLRPLMRGLAITPNVDQRIELMSRTLLSRPNLEKLARMTDLDLSVTSEAEKEALIKRLQNSIQLSGVRTNNSLYNISVIDPDRETARRMAQSLITIFIENSLNEKREDSTDAQSFLEKQIAQSEARLIEAENRLALFKQKNVDVLPGEAGDYYSRLQSAQQALAAAELTLKEVINRREALARQMGGDEPVFLGGASGVAPSPLDARIQTLTAQRDQLLSRYTDKHPEVRQLDQLIEELSAERNAMLADMDDGDYGQVAQYDTSASFQSMRTMVAESDAQIAELQVRVEEYRRRVEELGTKVNAIPEVEARLKQLDRDYGVLVAQHEEMLERRESARLGGDVENSAGDVSFRVIDPPFVPLKPSEPNKLILNAAVFIVALGGGAAIALLISLLQPLVADGRMLSNATGLPLLGSVTFAKTPEQRRKERWKLVAFSVGCAALCLMFGGVLIAPEALETVL